MGPARSFEIKCSIDQGDYSSREGWTRISCSPATTEEEMVVLLDAVADLAKHHKEWDVDYEMDPATASWHHKAKLPNSQKNRLLKLSGPVVDESDWAL